MSNDLSVNSVSGTNNITIAKAMIQRNLDQQVRVDSQKQTIIHPNPPATPKVGRAFDVEA